MSPILIIGFERALLPASCWGRPFSPAADEHSQCFSYEEVARITTDPNRGHGAASWMCLTGPVGLLYLFLRYPSSRSSLRFSIAAVASGWSCCNSARSFLGSKLSRV